MTSPTILLLAAAVAAASADANAMESIQGPKITAEAPLGGKRFVFTAWAFDFICGSEQRDPRSVVVSVAQPAKAAGHSVREGAELLWGAKTGNRLPIRVWVQDYGPAGATRSQPPDPDDNANWLGAGGRDPYWLVVLPRSWIANPKVADGSFRGRKLSQADGLWRTFDVLPHLAVDLGDVNGPDDYTTTLVFEVRTSKGVAVPFQFRGEGNHQRGADGFSLPTMALECPVRLSVLASQAPVEEIPVAKSSTKPVPPQTTTAPAETAQPPETTQQPEIEITAPSSGAVTSDRIINVSGSSLGLRPGTPLQLWVVTDIPYRMGGVPTIKADGTWTSTAILGGYATPYEHEIYAAATLDGKNVRSQTIRVTKQ